MGSAYDPAVESEDADHRALRRVIGERLSLCRKERGMTMVNLGRIAHCSQSFISKVESGNIIPSIPMLQRLARALDVKPSSLCSETHQSFGDQTDGRLIAREQDP